VYFLSGAQEEKSQEKKEEIRFCSDKRPVKKELMGLLFLLERGIIIKKGGAR
jgi:hypothetical protein